MVIRDPGVLRPVFGVSFGFLNRFGDEYLESSFCVGARGGLASCPADRGLRELVEREVRCRCRAPSDAHNSSLPTPYLYSPTIRSTPSPYSLADSPKPASQGLG